MITEISVAGTATFSAIPTALRDLKRINFFYGCNGSGKTTLSRIIAHCSAFPTCSVTWAGGIPLQTLVYNKDFVERNFGQDATLKGIFTLGEKNIETLDAINQAKSDSEKLSERLLSLTQTLEGQDGSGGKKAELATIEAELKSTCWAQKQKYDDKFASAFEGLRNNQERFRAKVLDERAKNTAGLEDLEAIELRAKTVFGQTPTVMQRLTSFDGTKLLQCETDHILKKRIIGKADIDIAAMIKKLGNSDWVSKGRVFYAVNDQHCPFCQQKTSDSLAESLARYFDETFQKETTAVRDLASLYAAESQQIRNHIASILQSPPPLLSVEPLKSLKQVFDSTISLNSERIAAKAREPSDIVELESLSQTILEIQKLLDETNKNIDAHNTLVKNLSKERQELTSAVWRYLLDVELKVPLSTYDSKRTAVVKAINALEIQITATRSSIRDKTKELRALEREVTSTQPTINGVNALLNSFGYRGFTLSKADDDACYKLLRADGTDAMVSISEGEKTFVTFLYFFHLLKGSNSESGMTTDRVIVFDDPVSSLDSEVLFIVSSLMKTVFEEIRSEVGHIKQAFVLTHNVYFHKEITYNSRRGADGLRDESFWIVRKRGVDSVVERHPTNPIRTSYELLWHEVRSPDRVNLTIQNTLRRILENYFKILGRIDFEDICGKFDGREKVICKSLLSWVHDGSHFAHDDLYVSIEPNMVESYLNVFKAIFEKMDHISHYNMMMGDAAVVIAPPIPVIAGNGR